MIHDNTSKLHLTYISNDIIWVKALQYCIKGLILFRKILAAMKLNVVYF